MAWYKDLSLGAVIVLLLILIVFYIYAIISDINTINRRRDTKNRRIHERRARYEQALQDMKNGTGSDDIRQYYKIPAARRDEIREVVNEVLDEREDNQLKIRQLLRSSRDGALIGLLGGAIIGGKDVALSGAFTWSVIRGVITGISFYT